MDRRATAFAAVSFITGFTFAGAAFAYTPTISSAGRTVKWTAGARLGLAGNPANQSGLSASSFYSAAVRGLQRWATASAGGVRFDYWQGSDPSVYAANSDYNGYSNLYFASNSGTQLSPNVLGLTQVWYNTETGEILETDIVLNDRVYQFTTDARHTSGYGASGGGHGNGVQVFVENVLTHELGHAFGLSHSGHLQSTMLYMEAPEQAYLGCDEQIGIRALYPVDGLRGSISGSVVSSANGQAVFGAHVQAISRRRGTVLGSAVTDRSGRYEISGLEPGSYFLMAEPFYAGSGALPSYFSGSSPYVCGGGIFSRTFLGSGAQLSTVSVGAGSAAGAPTISVACGYGGAAAVSTTGSSTIPGAPIVVDASGGASGFGYVDRVSSGTQYYRLRSVEGRVEVRILAYSLYAPIDADMQLVDSAGNPVGGTVANDLYSGSSGYVNYDSAIAIEGLPLGDYFLRVTATPLSSGLYPAGPTSMDSTAFLVIAGSLNEAAPPLSQSVPYNARCRMDENFPPYSSPAGEPARSGEEEDDGGFLGFCGTVARGADRQPPIGGPGAGAVAGWFLPWVTMLLAARLARRQARGYPKLMTVRVPLLLAGVVAIGAIGGATRDARAALRPDKIHVADAKKTQAYVRDGLIVGGDAAIDDVTVRDIRRAANREFERIVIDLEGTLAGEPAAIQRPPYYHVAVTPDERRLVLTLWGRPKLVFDSGRVVKAFKKSSVIGSVELLPRLDDESWTFVLGLKAGSPVEVFELSNPVRIIVDIKSSGPTPRR